MTHQRPDTASRIYIHTLRCRQFSQLRRIRGCRCRVAADLTGGHSHSADRSVHRAQRGRDSSHLIWASTDYGQAEADTLTLLRRQVRHPDRDRLLTARVAVRLGPAWLDSLLEWSSSCGSCPVRSALVVLLSTDLSMTPEDWLYNATENHGQYKGMVAEETG